MSDKLESLSNNMFAPLSDKEASLVVGGAADRLIGYCYYDAYTLWSDHTWTDDEVVVDLIYLVD